MIFSSAVWAIPFNSVEGREVFVFEKIGIPIVKIYISQR